MVDNFRYVLVAIVLVLIILCLCCIAAFCISRGLREEKPDKTQTYDIGTQAKMTEARGTQMSTESVNGSTNMQRLRRTVEMSELEDANWESRDSRRMPLSLPPNHRQFDGYY
ncbi:hypothetical protein WR25_02087 [Diploscapter pachys]|uniref:Uncharacterized protein n=1 Tax=Diploscapter pachys TaxID=2018661 RepID=A0A2A2K6Q2_9BILA|nr:hypothetical protein WR25_02087 [Diploscapter pachys]